MSATQIKILSADLDNLEHAAAVIGLLDYLARYRDPADPPLSDEVRAALIPGLRKHPGTKILLAYDGAQPVGLAVCFAGFSTFRARPLLNIHDLIVHPRARGRGVGRRLLEEVEATARDMGCCRITLEVHADNAAARGLYLDFGFDAGEEGATAQSFFTKHLDA